jgi:hypothetical protein
VIHKTTQHDNWLSVSREKEESKATYGDTSFDFSADSETFGIDGSTYRGRDQHNHDSYDNCEIALNEDEARELLLLLTVWLEQRS